MNTQSREPMTWKGLIGLAVLFGSITTALMLIAYQEHSHPDRWAKPPEEVKPTAQVPGM